jgi:hypothetical protein
MGKTSGSNSAGRVTAFQAVGRGFESRLPLKRTMRQSSLKARREIDAKFFSMKSKTNLTAKALKTQKDYEIGT